MSVAVADNSISLSGDWNFKLDPDNLGIKEQWFEQKLPDKAKLPGSLDEQKLGFKNDEICLNHLTRENKYIGKAWYQKEVTIPENWSNERIVLFLERAMWETRVYVDGNYIDTQDSLCVPHVYNLTDFLSPGKHNITILVDNSVKVNIGHTLAPLLWAHAITEETQTDWNGIIGKIELIATPKVWIDSVQTYSDFEKKVTKVKVTIGNITGEKVDGKINLEDLTDDVSVKNIPFSTSGKETIIEAELPFGKKPTLWDEYSPKMHELKVRLEGRCPQRPNVHPKNKVAEDGDPPTRDVADLKTIPFSLRDFRAKGHHFELNGRKIFLRGKLDCAIFPLTGYPYMSVKDWKRMFNIYKDYGLNHVRFHSWCPPEAAFVAADELGIILQPENPLWDGYGLVGSNPERAAFILAEANRIVDTYGNHPSFCLMSMGNELGDGTDPYLEYLVDYLKKKDPRHLYTATTHPPKVEREKDDYFVGAGTLKGVARGINPFKDFSAKLEHLKRPLIAHEIGQPAIYPNYKEIPKYTGHLKPRNLETFKKSLEDNNMLDLANDFQKASGKQAVEIYKENIEAQLRTTNVAGFQLLDLQDFPGQGTALIGLLDAFLDSKGLITPEKFREFCRETVPLIRTRSFTWNSDETFKATAEIAHYGEKDLKDVTPVWTIKTKGGKILEEGKFEKKDVPTGKTTQLGEFEFKLDKIKAPQQLVVEVSLEGRCPQRPKNIIENKVAGDGDPPVIANSWKVWVYPNTGNGSRITDHPSMRGARGLRDVTISKKWDAKTQEILEKGGKVLLMPDKGTFVKAEPSRWHPVFWCYQLFKAQPETMGILCDTNHLALAEFPTDFYADWQWHDLLEKSEALLINETPTDFRPIVQFVPDFNNNKKYAAIFEAKVRKGKLLFCSIDLRNDLDNRREAKQLLHSLITYMNSEKFLPTNKVAGDGDPPTNQLEGRCPQRPNSLDKKTLDKIFELRPTPKKADPPKNIENAVLNIRAGVNAPFAKPEPWTADADKAIALEKGFNYSVQGGVWRDKKSSSWHAQNLIIKIDCPEDFDGNFYVHFHDWDEQNRSVALFFCGKDLGPLAKYNGDGFWLKQTVTPEMAKAGKITLDARNIKGPNVMISQIILIPKEK